MKYWGKLFENCQQHSHEPKWTQKIVWKWNIIDNAVEIKSRRSYDITIIPPDSLSSDGQIKSDFNVKFYLYLDGEGTF